MTHITKFLRYPGSKRRMLTFLTQHLPRNSEINGRYIEPFVGSGAVFFMMSPRKSTLSDINPDLIDLFRGIKKHPSEVWGNYCNYGNSKKDYEEARQLSHTKSIQEKAARVLYLNRTCFKGMWRTNREGMFNVGYGGQDRRWAINEQNLFEVSKSLKTARIYCVDFEETIAKAEFGDFIFLDPPYKPGLKDEVNNHYIGKNFTFEDQQRLARTLEIATRNKVVWAMTNSSHHEIVKLYHGCYRLNLPAGTGNLPGLLVKHPGEVLIANYPLKGGKRIP